MPDDSISRITLSEFKARVRTRALDQEERKNRAALGSWASIAAVYERRGEKYPATRAVKLREFLLKYHEMQKEMHRLLQEITGKSDAVVGQE